MRTFVSIKRVLACLLIVVIFVCSAGLAFAGNGLERVTFLTEAAPPYSHEVGGVAKGIGVEILIAALDAVGIEKHGDEVEVMPWARAYNETLYTPYSCTFMMVRNPMREKLFKWVGPVVNYNLVYASKKGTVSINALEDTWQYSVGAVREDSVYHTLVRCGHPAGLIEKSAHIKEVVSKVAYGRIDLMLADERIIAHQIRALDMDAEEFEINYSLEKQIGYFAFNKDTPDEVVNLMQQGMDTIRESGDLARILGKYSLK